MDGLSDGRMGLRAIESRLPPGFRFHPSDEELVCYYLRNKQSNLLQTPATMLVEVDLHACEPWDLPEMAKLGADEWYFFSFRDRKYATGSRRNRATKQGYWKATGKDKAILQEPQVDGARSAGGGCRRAVAGARKTLVFYLGRAPNGRKSGWVMHEFSLHNVLRPKPKIQNNMQEEEDDWVLCRVFHKGKTNGQAGQAAGIVVTTTPCSSSSAPIAAHHLQVCLLPQQPMLQVDNKLEGLESLISSPAPIIMRDQARFGIQLHEDNYEHFLLDEQQQLDLSVLQAPTLLELEQAPGDVGAMEITTEMESLETTCGVLQGASTYYMQLY
ncbi:hypothetical protein E2562_012165 [Oryza meyeriana var. granulata]|uniref:NAC domain-containing protein n=1 Tax=Oryza meyeriana var. granulata TaxID=110450 RepID=A0A6G1F7C9_9ORYZ|nr:hypothetical protein E2562_012165 [Oryza meyeriana var. granulata]